MQSASEGLGEGPTAPHPFAKADVQESEPQNPTKDKMGDTEEEK
jgi:hypothetical protein